MDGRTSPRGLGTHRGSAAARTSSAGRRWDCRPVGCPVPILAAGQGSGTTRPREALALAECRDATMSRGRRCGGCAPEQSSDGPGGQGCWLCHGRPGEQSRGRCPGTPARLPWQRGHRLPPSPAAEGSSCGSCWPGLCRGIRRGVLGRVPAVAAGKGLIQLLPLSPACPGASRQPPSPALPAEGTVGCQQDPPPRSCPPANPGQPPFGFPSVGPGELLLTSGQEVPDRFTLWTWRRSGEQPSGTVAASNGQHCRARGDSPSARVTRISTSPSFILVTAAAVSSVLRAGHPYRASRTGRIRSGYSLESRATPGGGARGKRRSGPGMGTARATALAQPSPAGPPAPPRPHRTSRSPSVQSRSAGGAAQHRVRLGATLREK